MKGRKGVSGVVGMVILIALTVTAIGIVWVVVQGLIKDNLEGAGNCLDVFNKVEINNAYTCYTKIGGAVTRVDVSVKVGDIELSDVLVSISGGGVMESFHLKDEEEDVPGANSGLTYELNFNDVPDLIEIYPVVKGKRCDKTDSLSEIERC